MDDNDGDEDLTDSWFVDDETEEAVLVHLAPPDTRTHPRKRTPRLVLALAALGTVIVITSATLAALAVQTTDPTLLLGTSVSGAHGLEFHAQAAKPSALPASDAPIR